MPVVRYDKPDSGDYSGSFTASNWLDMIDRKLSVAPMLDWTDRYCRYFLRLLSKRTLLYSEMITTGAILRGDRARFLDFHPAEHPVALQLGGGDPRELAECARAGSDWGYDEINLNVGCPSNRVQSGRFGACLMAEPALVAECVAAMREVSAVPVTIKHRIGIDERDTYEELASFVETTSTAGCRTFIVHARKAWLQGLSPKQNREIPPLKYQTVYRLKRDFPALEFVINGGFRTLDQVKRQLTRLDGVMIGREAYANPWLLANADRDIYAASEHPVDRHRVVAQLLDFAAAECAHGTPLNRVTRHILGLFQGQPGARAWRRYLAEHAHLPGAGPGVISRALAAVPRVDQPG